MKKFIKVFVSLGLLVLLIYWIDVDQFFESIKNANYYYLAIALLIVIFNRILMAAKWDILLRAKNIKIPIMKVIGVYYISTFLGLFLPPTIGADAIRTYYIAKNNDEVPDVLSTIIIERVIGFIALFLAGLIGFLVFTFFVDEGKIDTQKITFLFGFLFIAGFGLFYISFKESFKNLILRFSDKLNKVKFLSKASGIIIKFLGSYQSFKDHQAAMISFTWLTFAEIFSVVVWAYFVALALDVELSILYFMAFIPVVLAGIRLPISVAGFGVNEGLYVYFLTLVGVSSSVAFSVGLVDHIIILIGLLPGGIFYWIYPKEKQVEEAVRPNKSKLVEAEELK